MVDSSQMRFLRSGLLYEDRVLAQQMRTLRAWPARISALPIIIALSGPAHPAMCVRASTPGAAPSRLCRMHAGSGVHMVLGVSVTKMIIWMSPMVIPASFKARCAASSARSSSSRSSSRSLR